MTHRMIVKTQETGTDGRATSTTEQIRNIPASQVEARREAARQSAPRGATRTIKVVSEN
jgi:hypothetical protein